MSQFDFGDLESPLPGATLINGNLEPWRDALHSLHSGDSRPSYAVAGTMWIDDTTNPWVLNVYDGTSDAALGTIDTSTHVFTPNGVSQNAADIDYTPDSASPLVSDNVEDALNEIQSAALETVETVRAIPQNSKSADYTLVASDAGKHIYHPSADTTTRTWTIPSNASVAFPIGTAITLVNDDSAGDITIAITSDTLVQSGSGSTGSRTLAENGNATILKVTSTRWIISGVGVT